MQNGMGKATKGRMEGEQEWSIGRRVGCVCSSVVDTHSVGKRESEFKDLVIRKIYTVS